LGVLAGLCPDQALQAVKLLFFTRKTALKTLFFEKIAFFSKKVPIFFGGLKNSSTFASLLTATGS